MDIINDGKKSKCFIFDKKIEINGRVVIPTEIRKYLNVSAGDKIAFVFDTDTKDVTVKKCDINIID